MLKENPIDAGKVLAVALWTLVGLLLTGTWVVLVITDDVSGVEVALVTTTLCASALAIVFHVRCYVVRIMCLVRVTAGLEDERTPPPLQSIR